MWTSVTNTQLYPLPAVTNPTPYSNVYNTSTANNVKYQFIHCASPPITLKLRHLLREVNLYSSHPTFKVSPLECALRHIHDQLQSYSCCMYSLPTACPPWFRCSSEFGTAGIRFGRVWNCTHDWQTWISCWCFRVRIVCCSVRQFRWFLVWDNGGVNIFWNVYSQIPSFPLLARRWAVTWW